MPSYESTTRRMPSNQPGLCALIQDTLPFYLEGDLSPESRAFIDAHLETCDRCASFLAGAQSIRGHFRREPIERSAVIDSDWRAREIIGRGRQQQLAIMLAVIGMLSLLAFVTGTMQLLPLMLAAIGVLLLYAFVTGRMQISPSTLAVIGVLALLAFAGFSVSTRRGIPRDSGSAAYATDAAPQPANGESVSVPTEVPAAAVESIPTVVPTPTPFLQPATAPRPTPTPVPAQP